MQQYYTVALMVVVLTIIPSCIEYSTAQQSIGKYTLLIVLNIHHHHRHHHHYQLMFCR